MSPQPVSGRPAGPGSGHARAAQPRAAVLRALVLVTPTARRAVRRRARGPAALRAAAADAALCAVARRRATGLALARGALAVVGGYWLGWGPARGCRGGRCRPRSLVLELPRAASLAALGPPGMRLDAVTCRTWRRRRALVLVGRDRARAGGCAAIGPRRRHRAPRADPAGLPAVAVVDAQECGPATSD